MIPRPKRRFTKVVVTINIALTWAVIGYAIYAQQPTVAVSGLTIIATIIGAYVGIGHLDMRSMLNSMRGTFDFNTFNPSPSDFDPPEDSQ